MKSDSESEVSDSDLDNYEEVLSDSNIFDDGLDDTDSESEPPKKKKSKSNTPKKGRESEDCIIIESDDESSTDAADNKVPKTEPERHKTESESSSDAADNVVVPKRVRFKSDTEPERRKSGKTRSERPKAKTKQRRRKTDIRNYFTPNKTKKTRKSSGNLISEKKQKPARKIPCRRNVRGETPLHTASIKGDFERVRLLVESDHDVNAQDNNGWTPLHEAANHNRVQIAGYLLDSGAHIDPRGGDDLETPLIDAASNGHIHMMKLLIEKGANCKCRDKENQTALDVLLTWNESENNKDVEFLREYTKLVAMLKKKMGQKESVTTTCKSKKKKAESAEQASCSDHTDSKDPTKSKTKKALSVEQPSSSHDIDGTELQHDTDDTLEWGEEDADHSSETYTSPSPSKTVHYRESQLDNREVVLLIPSKLQVSYEEHLTVQTELGVCGDQCIVWPPIHLKENITEDHIPHIMLDVVDRVRSGDLSGLATLLTGFNKEKYQFYLEQQRNGVVQNLLFFSIVDDLSEINSKSERKVGWLIDKDSLRVLVIYLYSDIPTHRHLVSSLQETLYVWNEAMTIKHVSGQKKPKEELEKLLKWLRSKLVCSYHTDIYPSRQCLFPMEKILYSEQYSCSVTADLINELTDLRRRLSLDSNTELSILGIDGVNREVLRFKTFLKKAIVTFSNDSLCKEIFFIVSVERSDEIDTLSDLVPANLITRSKVFTAFNPEKVQPSCILMHIKLDDDHSINMRHTARTDPQPSTSSTSSLDT